MQKSWKIAVDVLKRGGIGVLPTDTLFGLVGSALSKNTVERIYKVKGRDDGKPFVVLISSFKDLQKFSIKPVNHNKERWDKALAQFWPGQVSIILPCPNKSFQYLHRGVNSIAFRMVGPKNKNLFNLLKKVGPIVAPSANHQGIKPAQNITEAKSYFDMDVDFYVPGIVKSAKPSTLIDYNRGDLIVLRKGVVRVNKK